MGRRRPGPQRGQDRTRHRQCHRTLSRGAASRCDARAWRNTMSDNGKVPLPNLDQDAPLPPVDPNTLADGGDTSRGAADLEAVFDVPVQVPAVLGRAKIDVGDL